MRPARSVRHKCPGDDCPICQRAIDAAYDAYNFPDPDDAPRDWEPR